MDEDKFLERGNQVRETVTGIGYRPMVKVDPDLRKFISRGAFGDIWARPGLEISQRRLLAMAFSLALNHHVEWKMHAIYALRNGWTREQLKEVALQAAVYCGVPASIEAFQTLDDAFELYEQEEAWKKDQESKPQVKS